MTRKHIAQGVGAIGLIVVGVMAGVTWTERHSRGQLAGGAGTSTGSTGVPTNRDAKADEAVEVSLSPEVVERAGIKTAAARRAAASATVTVPGTVTSNSYRDTKVNALVGGVVRQVTVELGTAVTRGQPLTVIFSAELADAQMKYLAAEAMLNADHQKLERTQKLVTLGAASRQELEEITAVHAGHETEVAAARQRLLLLGLGPDDVSRLTEASHVVSEVTVRAPADGVVIARNVNPGQVVGAGQELFTVTNLSTVWVIGDLYEKDFAPSAWGAGRRWPCHHRCRGPCAGASPTSTRAWIPPREPQRCAWKCRTRAAICVWACT